MKKYITHARRSSSDGNIFTKQRKIVIVNYDSKCADCGKPFKDVHHLDLNTENNKLDNLLPLCFQCHISRHVSIGKRRNPRIKKRTLICLELLPEEKDQLIKICEFLNITMVEFVRRSMRSCPDMYEALKACEDYLCEMVVSTDKAVKLLEIVQDAMNTWEVKNG